MAINSLQDKFLFDLADIYDAEFRFMEGQQQMLSAATDQQLQQGIQTHMQQTQGHIQNLEQVFSLLGQAPQRGQNDVAAALVATAGLLIQQTQNAPAVADVAIDGAAAKVEHFEMACYRGLVMGAQLMNQPEVIRLLSLNLHQEEQTAALLEQSMPQLLQKASTGTAGQFPSSSSSLSQ